MSIATISYDSLEDASSEARAVAKKLDRYADAIHDHVYKKLNSYRGEWSSNLSTAKSNANSKISALRDNATKYEKYSSELIDLKSRCESTDKSVKSRVSSLTASFKDKHGISNNKVINAISYFFTSAVNNTSVGRWIGDVFDEGLAGVRSLKDSIAAWYNVDGGKEFLTGMAVGILEVVLGVLAVIGAIATGGFLIFIIAGVIAGAIMAINGLTNIVNESRGLYNAWGRDDPATARRRSETDTLQDTLRKETDSKGWHMFASGMDLVNNICSVVTIVNGGANLLKNGYKWATGSTNPISTINIKDVLSRGGLSKIGSEIKTSVGDFLFDAKKAIRLKDVDFWIGFVEGRVSDFVKNMHGKFFNFKEVASTSTNPWMKTIQTNSNIFTSASNILDVAKESIKGGFNFENLFKVAGVKIALPSITIVSIPVVQGDPYQAIKTGDFKGLHDKGKSIFDSYFKNDEIPINQDILNKLSSSTNINISIPEIYIPEIPEINIPEKIE